MADVLDKIPEHIHSRPSLKALLSLVAKLAPKWYELGIELLEDEDVIRLTMITANHSGDKQKCCLDMLQYWMDTHPEATWHDLVTALKSPGVELAAVASAIESNFTGSPSTSNSFDYDSSSSDSMKGSDRPTLRQLHKHVVLEAALKWKYLGVQLLQDDRLNVLDVIEKDHPNDSVGCCKHVFMRWLEITPDPSWNQLISALRSPTAQLNSLADQLEQMMSTELHGQIKGVTRVDNSHHHDANIVENSSETIPENLTCPVCYQLNKNITIKPKAMALMCKEHDLELLLFCKTCEELVCKHCVAKGHNDHDYANARMEVCKCQMFEKFTTSAEEVVRNVSEVQDTTDKTKKKSKGGSLATEKNFILAHVISVSGPHQINCDGQSGGCFVWKECGLEIFFPPKCSQQHIQVATSNFLPIKNEVHPGMHIVSAVYQFDCNIKRFDKAFTLRLQHCIKLRSPEDCERMRFVLHHDGSNDMKYGCFEAGQSYGTVKLNRFCHIFVIFINEPWRNICVIVLPISGYKGNSSLFSNQQSSGASVEHSPSQTNQRGISQLADDQQSSVPPNASVGVFTTADSTPYGYEAMFCLPKNHCKLLDWKGAYAIYNNLGEWRDVSKESILREGDNNFPVNLYADEINFDVGGVAKITCENTSENIVDVDCWPPEIKKEHVDKRAHDHGEICAKYPHSIKCTDVVYKIIRKSDIKVTKTSGTPSSNCQLIIRGIEPHQQVDLCIYHYTNLTLIETIDSRSTTNVNAGPVPSVSTSGLIQSHMYANIDASPRLRQSGILEAKPEMKDLIIMVIPRLKAEWEDVAYLLNYKATTIYSIKESQRDDPRKCCRALFVDWLETHRGVSPKDWGTLLNTIAESEDFTKIVEDILKQLEKKSLAN